MTEEKEISIPVGSQVSFIDPVTQLPVKGEVRLELKDFIGVHYTGTPAPAVPGKLPHGMIKKNGDFVAWTNIKKSKVFVVR